MRKGFTLLELLIVVVILGVLALIAAPALLNAADEAKNGAVKANVSAAASTATSKLAISGQAPETADDAIVASLNDNGNSKNPITGAANPFTTGAGTAGQVSVVGDDTNNLITITGYDKNAAALITKTIRPPQ